MKQWKAFWAKPSHVAYLFVMPVVLLLLIFRLILTVAAFVCSFFDMDMFLVGKGFVGFQNNQLYDHYNYSYRIGAGNFDTGCVDWHLRLPSSDRADAVSA